MKFRCLVIDYDNTAAATVPDLQYPALRHAYEVNNLGGCPSLDEYLAIDFDIGIRAFIKSNYPKISEKMIDDFTKFVYSQNSKAYEGLGDILGKFVASGGELYVASNSDVDAVIGNWRLNKLPEPMGVYGWDMGEEYRKPNSKSLEDVLEKTKFGKKDVLVVDDRESGVKMAKSLGVQSAVAGWGLAYRKGFEWMKNNSKAEYFLSTVQELEKLIFGE